MGALFRLTAQSLTPAPDCRVLKARDFSLLLESRQLLEAARTRAAEMDKAAQEAYDARLKEGYEEGMMEGRMEQASKMMETAMQAVEFIEHMEETLVQVVTSAVRKVVGEMDNNERIVRIVRTALLSVRSQQRVLIRVAPSDEAAVRRELAVMMKAAPGEVSFLDVSPDPRMSSGDCILESELGVVDASLETQLKALENALGNRVKQG